MSISKFKTICVFCGSSLGKKQIYQDAAINLAKEMVLRSIDLVYGGGNIGLMGLISETVFDGGRHVLGVIPKTLMGKEIIGVTIGEVKPFVNMHQRKAEMSRHTNAFIGMCGYGTLEELFEMITWAQLGIHNKPVRLLNIDGYYNSLLFFINQAIEEGFIKPSAQHIIVSASNAKELIANSKILLQLREYYPCHEEVALKLNWNS
ncbi:Cytokinin riboside 5'-monophosphate phosphoribohydrolase LOG protein [Dioscorea alata]|uniref:Cytokinin riboside 5'-monophosphate phosphoribohydrolase LOG protein n=1 Tax=Dioscorea alata TaxID=55571 RepID=A0ACB7UH68_DIOAL|nr:Cytokinin riboside 5'-monophosphate phosphoribohydrolase LOG protein [Dioscorea alata]